jgi:GntR family transcriptional regulator
MVIERPVPIVEQVNRIIRDRILEGVYSPGARLPSEQELSAEMGISRASLRMAMAPLVSEGLIVRKQGDGTYVNKRGWEVSTCLDRFWSFIHMIEAAGCTPRVDMLSVSTRQVTEDEADRLLIAYGSNVLVLERLFRSEYTPAIHSTNIIPAGLMVLPLAEGQVVTSLQDMLRDCANVGIEYSTSDIKAALPNEDVAASLSLPPNAPILFLLDVFYNAEQQPVALGYNYYNEKILGMRLVRRRT